MYLRNMRLVFLPLFLAFGTLTFVYFLTPDKVGLKSVKICINVLIHNTACGRTVYTNEYAGL